MPQRPNLAPLVTITKVDLANLNFRALDLSATSGTHVLNPSIENTRWMPSMLHMNVFKAALIFWREDHGLPDQLNGMKLTCFSLSLCSYVCMYVLVRIILSQRPCSLCSYACNGIPGPTHPPKMKYSLRSHKLHCLFPLLVQAEREYFTLGGCACLERPLHTYEQREQGL